MASTGVARELGRARLDGPVVDPEHRLNQNIVPSGADRASAAAPGSRDSGP